MEREFEKLSEIEPFMDHEESYHILKNVQIALSEYIETWRVIQALIDDKNQCIKVPPLDAARNLDKVDTHLPMPDSIFRFVEKAYRDGYYQINKHRCAFYLGRLYSEERYGHVDFEKATAWFARGAKALDGEAEAKLGKCYYLGLGLPVDYKKAFHYLVKWALIEGRRSAEAMYLLGDMYFHGHYVEKDEVQAYDLYRRAEELLYDENNAFAAEIYLRIADYNLNQICTEESCYTALKYYQYSEISSYERRKKWYKDIAVLLDKAVAGESLTRKRIWEMNNGWNTRNACSVS